MTTLLSGTVTGTFARHLVSFGYLRMYTHQKPGSLLPFPTAEFNSNPVGQ
jgi:hypothetical protein